MTCRKNCLHNRGEFDHRTNTKATLGATNLLENLEPMLVNVSDLLIPALQISHLALTCFSDDRSRVMCLGGLNAKTE